MKYSIARVGGVLSLCLALAGCEVDPYCLLCTDADPNAETGPPVDGCVPGGPEFCNGKDDNCDDVIDEGFNLNSDAANCGECGVVCQFPSGIPACVGGECVLRGCLPGAVDEDGNPDNGCEAGCTITTTVNSDHCSGDDCCDGADNDCDGQIGEDHNINTDPRNCGACSSTCTEYPCDHVCDAPFAVTSCSTGICQIDECEAGYFDIDGDFANGCEYNCVLVGDGEETCNGIDDDCDGAVDEEFEGMRLPCPNDVQGACTQGTLECVNGMLRCVGGVQPSPELCDDVDNDCDGETDEGGICEGGSADNDRDGTTASNGDCDDADPEVNPDAAEVCGDGVDNDCDGLIDGDDPDLGLGEVCDDERELGSEGVCAWGQTRCQAGEVVCADYVGPIEEVCNGADDDCNGQIDDGIPLRRTCGPNISGLGLIACISGEDTCVGFLPLRPELCDGLDNDANDEFDDGAACPAGSMCEDGQCRIPCSSEPDEHRCPPGLNCVEGLCRGDLCSETECDECQRCDTSTGLCIDACEGLGCPSGLICHCGACWPPSCGVLGCPQWQICQEGRCTADPCAAADCEDDQGCAMGECFDVCQPDQCPVGERCYRGECVEDLCAVLSCPVGSCNPDRGECSNLCVGNSCLPGMTCDLETGRCVDDICLTVRCPEGSHCEKGSCVVPPEEEIPDAGPQPDSGGPVRPDGGGTTSDAGADRIVLISGGGGCTCNAPASQAAAPAAAVLLVLGLAAVVLRRR